MAADYIPGADGAFDAWQSNFVTYATANVAALGLDPLVRSSLHRVRQPHVRLEKIVDDG